MQKLKRAIVVLLSFILFVLPIIPTYAANTKEIPISSVSMPTSATFFVGETKEIAITTSPTNATYKTRISWNISMPKGAFSSKVNRNTSKPESVTLTGKQAGTGSVTAKVETLNSAGKVMKTFNFKANITVKAKVPLKGISFKQKTATMNVGDSLRPVVTYSPSNTTDSKKITWTTSNKSIASVTSSGKVLAKKSGTVTITANVNGKKATLKITIKNPITQLSLSKTNVTVNEGSSVGITTRYTPADTTDSKTVKWTSSNTKVATVSTGTIYGRSAGTCTVTAQMGSKTAKIKVTVKAVPNKFVDVTNTYTILNKYRKNAKLKTLKRDTKLEKIAQQRAKEIVTKFDHTRPNGKRGLELIPGNLYKGENIAKGQQSTNEVMVAWYNSKGHRANMLGKNYTKVGIAGYRYKGVMYWAMMLSS